jgi:hypothetical protein
MATYYVRVEHEVIEYAILEVEADNIEHALELAETDLSLISEASWTLDDYIGDNSYIPLDDNYNPIED